MEDLYKVLFTIGEGGPSPDSILGKRIADSFTIIRNKAINETGLNDMYPIWNRVYDKMYGEENHENDAQYWKWMSERINEFLRDFNERGYCIRIVADPDDLCDLVGYFNWPIGGKDKDVKISSGLRKI